MKEFKIVPLEVESKFNVKDPKKGMMVFENSTKQEYVWDGDCWLLYGKDKVKIIETEEGIELVSTDFVALDVEVNKRINPVEGWGVSKSWAVRIKGRAFTDENRIEFHILLKKIK